MQRLHPETTVRQIPELKKPQQMVVQDLVVRRAEQDPVMD
jgi:hypothetical protein